MNGSTLKEYELFKVQDRWQLSVWCSSHAVDSGRRMLARVRGHHSPHSTQPVQRVRVQGVSTSTNALGSACDSLEPVLFENQGYELVFELANGWKVGRAWHKLAAIGLAFRHRNGEFGGYIDFGNDIGWFTLNIEIEHEKLGQEAYSVSMEVHPRKLDLERDLTLIQRDIDAQYPLWLFSFAQKTEQGMRSVRQNTPPFPMLWLAHFTALKDELSNNIGRVLMTPHRRLAEKQQRLRPEAVHRRLSVRQEERVATAFRDQDERFRLAVELRHLSVDTVENRFVKGVLRVIDRELGRLSERLRAAEGLSASGIDQLSSWRKEFRTWAERPLFKDVGEFTGLSRESLVLHQRTGYAGVYRAWQQFKLYLEVFGRSAQISVKTINELYEVWCVIEVKRLLVELGFAEVNFTPLALRADLLELSLVEGESAAFVLVRKDVSGQAVTVRLLHEPRYEPRDRRSSATYLTRTISQRPDIVLEATFPNGERIVWIFDAKYRLATTKGNADNNESFEDDPADDSISEGQDLVPADAINQMHRYRDAILSSEAKEPLRFFRPVIGAFALFPGWHPNQKATKNHYQENIAEVGIGAFPLLPNQDPVWLRTFLGNHLLPSQSTARYSAGPDEVLGHGAARITAPGLSARRRTPLVLLAHVGPDRDANYLEDFFNGRAEWFHVRPLALERASVTPALLADLTHCAVAIEVEPNCSAIRFVYQLHTSAQLVERGQISNAQSGTSQPTGSGLYWLFNLGRAEELKKPLVYTPTIEPYRVRIIPLSQLRNGAPWEELQLHYEGSRSN
jgi:hypothetical protein